eukprot:9126219-Karenia_brevis.AAC.1
MVMMMMMMMVMMMIMMMITMMMMRVTMTWNCHSWLLPISGAASRTCANLRTFELGDWDSLRTFANL